MLIYLVVAVAHLVLFWGVFEFPFLCTDAVQYVTTAANLVRGNGYSIRGSLNSTCPPLYPAFLGLAFWLGPDPRTTAFVLSCLVISLVVVPAYLLARWLRLGRGASAALALAAGFLPHTLYCSFYMAESLYLPLFVGAGFYAYRWFAKPHWRISIALGLLVSAMLLVKIAAFVVVAAVTIAALARVSSDLRVDRKQGRATGLSAALMLGIVAATQGIWLGWKAFHQGQALGIYGTVLRDQGLPFLSGKLVAVYAADYLLAPGLLTAIPLVYFLVLRWRSERWPAAYFTLLFALQLGWVAIVDGGITGMLRERLLSFSFPIVGVFATKGFLELRTAGSRAWQALFFCVPPVLAAVLYQYDFHEPSAVEFPWAYAFGAVSGVHLREFLAARMVATTAIVSVLAGLGVWLVARRAGGAIFSVLLLGFQLAPLCVVAFLLGKGAPVSLAMIAPIKNWLASNSAGYDAHILIASAPAYFELRPRDLRRRGLFPECRPGSAVNPITIWQLETYFRWDVRSVCDAGEVNAKGRLGDLFLSTHEVSGARLLSRREQYRLYRLTGAPVVSIGRTSRLFGYVDYPQPGAEIQRQSVVGGWALAGDSRIIEVSLFADGRPFGTASIHGRRPDVKAIFPTEPEALFSGFYTVADFSRLAPGKHTLVVKVRTDDGETLALGPDISFLVVK